MDRGSMMLRGVREITWMRRKECWRALKGAAVGGALFVCLLACPGASRAKADAPIGGSGLPDGRFYEQVSPMEKGGAFAGGNLNLVQSSPDGNALTFFSEPTLPGSEGSGSLGSYLASRSAQEWTTQGLLPSAALGREGFTAGSSADLKYSYLRVNVPGSGQFYYRRDNATRTVTPIFNFRGGEFVTVATSSDDTRLLFEFSGKLLPEAAEGRNVYMWDSDSGAVSLVSVLNTGSAPAEGAFAGSYAWPEGATAVGGAGAKILTPGALTEDGTGAFFTTAGSAQLYLRRNIGRPQSQLTVGGECEDPENACTVEVSRSQASTVDPNGEKPAAFLAATTTSPSIVFFASSGQLTDNATTGPADEGFDLYRYEVDTGHLTDVIPDPSDPAGAEFRGLLGTDAAGTRAYFVANGVLAEGATPGTCSLPPTPRTGEPTGSCNLYFWENGAGIAFVARLNANGVVYPSLGSQSTSDATNWMIQVESGVEPSARVSEDGQVLVFRSQEQLTSFQNEGVPEFYRYVAPTKELACITCGATGKAEASGPTLFNIESFISIPSIPPALTRNLSATGGRFIFQSPEALVAGDSNGAGGCSEIRQPFSGVPSCQDVYEWEASGEGTCTAASSSFSIQDSGCLYLMSTGTSSDPSFIADADRTAENVFFYTSQQLVRQDRDQLVDIYDARVGGGISTQTAEPPEECDDEAACRGAGSSNGVAGGTAQSEGAPSEAAVKRLRCGRGMRKGKRHGQPVCKKVRGHSKKKKHSKAKQGPGKSKQAGGKARGGKQ